MFYAKITETTCKMRRFSGIYVLYVKFDSQKTQKSQFGYWRPWVFRRLASIVVVRRSFLSPSTPCFARARRRKQLSTVSYLLTRHFDQKKRTAPCEWFSFLSKRCYDSNLSCVARCEFALSAQSASSSLVSGKRENIHLR